MTECLYTDVGIFFGGSRTISKLSVQRPLPPKGGIRRTISKLYVQRPLPPKGGIKIIISKLSVQWPLPPKGIDYQI